ncbi:MAG: hypothetical protein JNK05_39130 [Myxococcales bacterium]|nr:hypothetical protein [Myxococcales bacterium]
MELVFDYGDHDTNAPTLTASQSWPARIALGGTAGGPAFIR